MFLLNSRLGLSAATTSRFQSKSVHVTVALLLPKVQSHFAEFLSEGFLARLSILYQPTCVGLRYGQYHLSLEAFLGSVVSICLQHVAASEIPQRNESADLPTNSTYISQGNSNSSPDLTYCVPPSLKPKTLAQEY